MIEKWAAEPNRLQQYLEPFVNATSEQQAAARSAYPANGGGSCYQVNGDTAQIFISGVLRKTASPLALYLGIGGSTYAGIIEACEAIKALDGVKKVILVCDSPGGMVDGLDEARQALDELAKKKEMTAKITGMCASACYWLATAARRIESTSPANLVGSIGVVVAHFSFKGADEKLGIKQVVISSKNAPNKMPDLETEGGREVIQKQVDALERIFYQRIAEGRGISAELIADRFGAGGLLVSQDPNPDEPSAIKAGMIDAVMGGGSYRTITSNPTNKGSKAMLNEEQMKSALEVVGGQQYPPALKRLAEKVICNEAESASLSCAKALWDTRGDLAGKENAAEAEAQAKAEADFQKELAAARRAKGLPDIEQSESGTPASGNGAIETEADLEAAANRLRAMRGKKE